MEEEDPIFILLSRIEHHLDAIRNQLAAITTIAMLHVQQTQRDHQKTQSRQLIDHDGPSYLRFALPDNCWLRVRLNANLTPDQFIIEDQHGQTEILNPDEARLAFPDLPIWTTHDQSP